tara:strand:+ start:341 stop:463 length:123 start_codon:yes stop_codon:yes gene_type:complete
MDISPEELQLSELFPAVALGTIQQVPPDIKIITLRDREGL